MLLTGTDIVTGYRIQPQRHSTRRKGTPVWLRCDHCRVLIKTVEPYDCCVCDCGRVCRDKAATPIIVFQPLTPTRR